MWPAEITSKGQRGGKKREGGVEVRGQGGRGFGVVGRDRFNPSSRGEYFLFPLPNAFGGGGCWGNN